MCTLILVYKVLDGFPVVLAENRDAHLKSVEVPPAKVYAHPKTYAAIDKRSDGTWFGVNEFGVAVGLTNLHSMTDEIKPIDSRGQLCLEVLKQPSARDVSGYLHEVYEFERYAKVNILGVDESDAILTMCDKEITVVEFDAGIHVLTNYNLAHQPETLKEVDLKIDSEHRRTRAGELVEEYGLKDIGDLEEMVAILETILSDHVKSDHNRGTKYKQYFTICCHGNEQYPWKTTSSSIAALSEKGIGKSRYWYCAGNPCESEFREYSHILNIQ